MSENVVNVTVVIPTYNRADAAVRCARSVLNSDFAGGIEVVIVDDCSTKCVVSEVVRKEIGEDPRVRVIRHEKNKNSAGTRNTGGRNAHGQYVFFLDDDNELQPDTIARLVAVLDQGEYGVVAPLSVNVATEGHKTVWGTSFAFNEWTSTPRNTDADVEYTPEFAQSMQGRIIDTWYSPNAYMMPRGVFEEMGGYYEWFGIYMEESDLCMRIRESGRKVGLVGDAVTWHRHYNDTGDMVMRRFAVSTPAKAYLLSRNRMFFAWRHYSLLKVLSIMCVFAPLVTLRYLAIALIRGWPKIGLGFVAGYVAGTVKVLGMMLARPFAGK